MPRESTRTQNYPSGIEGVAVGLVERVVPADEPAPLPVNRELSVIGKSARRINGRDKVTGAARFTVDVKLPGMLHARLLRSPHPHARVLSIDLEAARREPDVRALHVITRVFGRAVDADEVAAAGAARGSVLPRAVYVGAPIVAVAATTADAAAAAMRLIKVAYEKLPFVVDMEDARQPDAAVVFRKPVGGESFAGGALAPDTVPLKGNVRGPNTAGSRGDSALGFSQSDVVIESEFSTQVQTHCCLETHAVVADWRHDGLTLYLSTQFTAGVRNEIAAAFGLPRSRVRVVVEAMGGGFGSKTTAGTYVHAAVALSRLAAAPVRLVLDRHEEQIDSGNRPATFQRLRLGATRDGSLRAITLYAHGTAGTGIGAGVGTIAQAMYDCPNFELSQYDVFINAGPGCAMRAPGNVPGAFALEQSIDELAEKLRIDPLALRDRIDPSAVRREQRRRGAAMIGWERRRPAGAGAGRIRYGIGMAQSFWGANVQINSGCEVRILRDGSVEVLSSVQDIGTGIGTVLAQVVAEELGLGPDAITVRIGDTDFPAGPPSHGSRTTASVTPPARNAAHQLLQRLFDIAAPLLDAEPANLVASAGFIAVKGNGNRTVSFAEVAAHLPTDWISAVATRTDDYGGYRRKMGDAAAAQSDLGGVQFAEVEVDTWTGRVRVMRVVAVQDCGRPINPMLIESQIHGGVLQGVSYALFENRVIDRPTGHVLNANLEQYKIIGASEIPAIDVHVLENYQGRSSTDAYGIAEPASIATAPAVANAVYNALGVRIRALPMTAAAVLGALNKIPGGSP
ncbi:MAG: xanthine dehydrogenase family protein molybdopterin-binding subunit [Rhodomicrobium sp.]